MEKVRKKLIYVKCTNQNKSSINSRDQLLIIITLSLILTDY